MPLAPTRAWRRRKKKKVWDRVISGRCYGGSVVWVLEEDAWQDVDTQWKHGGGSMESNVMVVRKARNSGTSWQQGRVERRLM